MRENVDKVFDIHNRDDIEIQSVNQECAVIRRGPGSKTNHYAAGIHQDFGLKPEDYHANLVAYTGN